ncbi:MAG: crossover junction endodeoxyribonuclease RuvC [Rikenellaceae bacterium]
MKSKSEDHYYILGIDPGTNFMGYGVLEVRGSKLSCAVMGVIDMHRIEDPYEKLNTIFRRIGGIIDDYKPREVALEAPFFGENVQSMLKLGRAQGVAIAAAVSRGAAVFEYAPRRIKQAITGQGQASKEQLADMVCSILKAEAPSNKLDATDGMAAALCHYFSSGGALKGKVATTNIKGLGGGIKELSKKGSSSWESFMKANPEREIGATKNGAAEAKKRVVKRPIK